MTLSGGSEHLCERGVEILTAQLRSHTLLHTCPSFLAVPFLDTWVLYQRPGSLRILRSILTVLRTALFWTEISDVVLGSVGANLPVWGGHSPKFFNYHWYHCCLQFLHPFNFLLQPLVFFQLFVFLLLYVAATWNCYIYQACFLL